MKKVVWIIPAMILAAIAEEPATNSVPTFAAEWRVTGFVRHGQHEEASIEHAGRMPRFIKEGDRLPDDILVMDISYDQHSVTLCKGNEKAILHGENYMAPPPPPPKPLIPVPSAADALKAQKAAEKAEKAAEKPKAIRDESGRWAIQFSNGKTLDMQSYVARHGGTEATVQHVKELMERETDPDRIEYRKQQLRALKAMHKAGIQ